MKIQSAEDLEKISRQYQERLYRPDAVKVNIGMASCGIAAGAQAAFDKAADAFADDDTISICQTGCIGFCEQEPLVEILADGKPRVIYKNITADRIVEAIEDYRQGMVPLIVPLTLLKHHLSRHPVPDWVHQQVYLHPYAKELMLRNHV